MSTTIIMTADEVAFVQNAAKEWRAIQKGRDFNGYMKIGAALTIGRRIAFLEARTNDIQAPTYKKAFSVWCADNGFGDMDAATRANLLFLQEPENRVLCDVLRQQMSDRERRQISHPAAMVRRIRSHKQKLEGAEKLRVKPRDDRDAVIARLEEQAAASDIDPAEIARHYLG